MKLFFIYNASNNFWNKKIDFLHKIVSPETYACELCKLTHGLFFEKKEWAAFREEAWFDMEFYYKEDYETVFGLTFKGDLPLVLFECVGEKAQVFISTKELQALEGVGEFIALIRRRLKEV